MFTQWGNWIPLSTGKISSPFKDAAVSRAPAYVPGRLDEVGCVGAPIVQQRHAAPISSTLAHRTVACSRVTHVSSPDRSQSAQSERTPQWRRGVSELCILKLLGDDASDGYEIVTTLYTLGRYCQVDENLVNPPQDNGAERNREHNMMGVRVGALPST